MPITSTNMGRTHRRRQRRHFELEEAAVAAAQRNDTPPIQWLPGLLKQLHMRGWTNPKRLLVRNFGSTGRGLCAKRASFNVGEELIRLPFGCLISMITLQQDAAFQAIFKQEALHISENAVSCQAWLSFYLLFQKHKRHQPLVRSYLRTLPDTFAVPYFCPLSEMQFMPDVIIKHVLSQNRQIRHSYDVLSTSLLQQTCDCCGRELDDLFEFNDYKWSWFVVNTRSIYIDVKNNENRLLSKPLFFARMLSDAPNTALAPFLDLFNHADKVSTKTSLVLNAQRQLEFVIKLTGYQRQPAIMRAQKQLFISYGELNDFQLLLEYGMVLPSNEHNIYPFTLRELERFVQIIFVPKRMSFDSEKFRFLRDHHFDESLFVQARDNGMSHNLHVALHLLFRESNSNVQRYAAAAFGDAAQLKNCSDILRQLLHWRVRELKDSIKELEPLGPLSRSGNLCVEYLHVTVRFLQRICLMHLS